MVRADPATSAVVAGVEMWYDYESGARFAETVGEKGGA